MSWRLSDELEELLNGLADELLSEAEEARLAGSGRITVRGGLRREHQTTV